MRVDILDLAGFYATPLGARVRTTLARDILRRWPSPADEPIVGYGYVAPYIGALWPSAQWKLFMPAHQGVMAVSGRGGANCAVLTEAASFPLRADAVGRVMAIHALETTPFADDLIAEFRRVLVPGGRLLLVVPKRTGLWARSDRTPFGVGRPYSRRQLAHRLEAAGFAVLSLDPALVLPPFVLRRTARIAAPVERALRFALPAGCWVADLRKQVPAHHRQSRPLRFGVAQPAGL